MKKVFARHFMSIFGFVTIFLIASISVIIASEVAGTAQAESVSPQGGSINWYANNINSNVYSIETASEFASLNYLVDSGVTFQGKTINITKNISLEGQDWLPIMGACLGSATHLDCLHFNGTLNGNGKTISNINVTKTSIGEKYIGVFAILGTNAKVKNLNLNGEINITNNASIDIFVGGIAGFSRGSIDNCKVEFNINVKHTSVNNLAVGTIVGHNYKGVISNSSAKYSQIECVANLAGEVSVGGIVGILERNGTEGILQNCSSNIKSIKVMSGVNVCFGGVAGKNLNATIINSYANVSTYFAVGKNIRSGGVVGYSKGLNVGTKATIINSYWNYGLFNLIVGQVDGQFNQSAGSGTFNGNLRVTPLSGHNIIGNKTKLIDALNEYVNTTDGSFKNWTIINGQNDNLPEHAEIFSVGFNTSFGTAPLMQNIIAGQKVTEADNLSESGYRFLGWFTSLDNGNTLSESAWNFDAEVVVESFTLYAKWQKLLTLSFSNYFTYNGVAQVPEITIEGVTAGHNVSVDVCDYSQNVNANNYSLAVSLSGLNSNLYYLDITQISYEIGKIKIDKLNWLCTQLNYNGLTQYPNFSMNNIIEGDDVSLLFTSIESKYASKILYQTAFILTGTSVLNYELNDNINKFVTYEIKPKVVSVSFANTTFVYDATFKKPTGAFIVNLCEGDRVEVQVEQTIYANARSLSYSTGYYLFGLEAKNYTLSATENVLSGIAEFYITQKNITLSSNISQSMYGSALNLNYALSSNTPLASIETLDMLNINYNLLVNGTVATINKNNHYNVGVYGVSLSYNNSNYNVSFIFDDDFEYEIIALAIKLEYASQTSVYEQAIKQLVCVLAEGEFAKGEGLQNLNVNYMFTQNLVEVVLKNADEYNIMFAYDNDNYLVSFAPNKTYTITPKLISLLWNDAVLVDYENIKVPSVSILTNALDSLILHIGIERLDATNTYKLTATVNSNNYLIANAIKVFECKAPQTDNTDKKVIYEILNPNEVDVNIPINLTKVSNNNIKVPLAQNQQVLAVYDISVKEGLAQFEDASQMFINFFIDKGVILKGNYKIYLNINSLLTDVTENVKNGAITFCLENVSKIIIIATSFESDTYNLNYILLGLSMGVFLVITVAKLNKCKAKQKLL